MAMYTAIFVTDAWDDVREPVIVSFDAPNDSEHKVLIKFAKLALAKDIYDVDGLGAEENKQKSNAELLKELESDGFYFNFVGLFKGRNVLTAEQLHKASINMD